MPQSLYEVLWLFIIYSFLGWCVEVVFCGLNEGHFINRGFLNGVWCPIYGFGMLLLIFFLYPLRENQVLLFLGSVLFTSLLEFLTGFVLEKAFHSRWWDYSDMPFNVCGYICLKFSLYWGIAGTFVIDVVHEFIYRLITLIPQIVGNVLLGVLMIAFGLDCWLTLRTILHLQKKLHAMDELEKGLRHISDDIGENIYESAETVADLAAEAELVFRENLQETRHKGWKQGQLRERLNQWKEANRNEWDELFEKYKEAFSGRKFGEKRLVKAFPNLKLINMQETLEKYRRDILRKNDAAKEDHKEVQK